MSTTEPYSPMARAKASAVPAATAGQDRRQHDPPEHRQRPGAERRGRLLDVVLHRHQHRLHRPHHERQRDEQQRDDDPGALAVEVRRRSATSVPYSVFITRPATIVGSANGTSMISSSSRLPGNWSRTSTQATQRAHHRVDRADQQRAADREPQRGRGRRLVIESQKPPHPALGRLQHHRGQRQQHQQAHPEHRDAEPDAGHRTEPEPSRRSSRPAAARRPPVRRPAGDGTFGGGSPGRCPRSW